MGRTGDGEADPGAAPPAPRRSTAFLIVVIVASLAFVTTCGVGVLATLLMPALLKAREKANRTKCANNLRQIGLAAIQYADDKRSYPHDPTDPSGREAMGLLWDSGYLDDPAVFICPSDPTGGPAYVGFPVLLPSTVASSRPIAWEARPHRDGGRNVLFADCHVEWVLPDRFEALAKQAAQPVRRGEGD